MKPPRTYSLETVEAARHKILLLREQAKTSPRVTTATAVKLIRSEIRSALETGVTLEQMASALRTGDDLGIIEVTAPTLKRYYHMSKTPVPKHKSSRDSATPRTAKASKNVNNGKQTVQASAERRTGTRHGFAQMPPAGEL